MARADRIVIRDPQVLRVVMQQDADPLSNPFGERMPRSPFRSGTAGPAPAAMDEQPMAPTLPDGDVSVKVNQPDGNPFDQPTPRTGPGISSEPGRLEAPDPFRTPGDAERQEPYLPEAGMTTVDPKAACDEALRRFRANQLTGNMGRRILDLTLPPDTQGRVAAAPYECNLSDQRFAIDSGRDWRQTWYTWKASGLCHKPLYFEQSHMERYGHSWGPVLDPLVSGAHFFGSVPFLPYKMGLEPPGECIYPLGHYRPGNCAPHYIEPFPWSLRAAAVQAGATTGLIYALP